MKNLDPRPNPTHDPTQTTSNKTGHNEDELMHDNVRTNTSINSTPTAMSTALKSNATQLNKPVFFTVTHQVIRYAMQLPMSVDVKHLRTQARLSHKRLARNPKRISSMDSTLSADSRDMVSVIV